MCCVLIAYGHWNGHHPPHTFRLHLAARAFSNLEMKCHTRVKACFFGATSNEIQQKGSSNHWWVWLCVQRAQQATGLVSLLLAKMINTEPLWVPTGRADWQ